MRAERNEIREMISFLPVLVKFTEGYYMMNLKLFVVLIICHSTYLANVAISLARLSALAFPVWAIIRSVTTFPGWIILPNLIDAYPFGAATIRTEVVFISVQSVRLARNFLSAHVTRNTHRIPFATTFCFEFDCLPLSQALFVTEVILFVPYIARTSKQRSAAKRAFDRDLSPFPERGLLWVFFAPLIVALLRTKAALCWARVFSLESLSAMRTGLNGHACTIKELAALEAMLLSRQHAKAARKNQRYDSCSCYLDKSSIALPRGVVNAI